MPIINKKMPNSFFKLKGSLKYIRPKIAVHTYVMDVAGRMVV